MRRFTVLLFAVVATLSVIGAGSASADPVLGISCTTSGDGIRLCGDTTPRSTVKSWDDTPIDVNVALPDSDDFGPGPCPLDMMFHDYRESKVGFAAMKRFNDEGYATFSMTDRGFYESCGSTASVAADPIGCDGQYVRLMDARYEVRDAQFFAGELADAGLVKPTEIAATGNSYGGGMSMALAVLKDRTMLPDGTLVPWTSEQGTPMALAAAAPFAPWTDLAYSLVPNGRTLDYLRDNSYDPNHFGVMKQSITNGLFMTGNAIGRYAPAGEVPEADLAGWLDLLNQGEPYQNKPAINSMFDEIKNFHSSYYLNHDQAPAPLAIGAGFTDDIFPVDEAIRFYNRTRADHPGTPMTLMLADFGHQRAQNKAPESTAWANLQLGWINWHVLHKAPKQNNEVTVWTETCPASAPSAGPMRANDWASFGSGEIVVQGGADQVIKPWGGNKDVATAFGVLGPGACASPAGAKESGTANYESAPAPSAGFTMVGAPTVVADLQDPGTGSEIAARLVDVAPNGTKSLVARQLYRADSDGYQVFQLHPGAWRFEAGHIARLELLPKDGPSNAIGGTLTNYGRPSDQQQEITVKDLVLRLPVIEAPGSLNGLVKAVAPKILPNDRGKVNLASGYLGSVSMAGWIASRATGLTLKSTVKAKGKAARVSLACQTTAVACDRSTVKIQAKVKGRTVLIARKQKVTVAPQQTKSIALKLTGKARTLIGGRKVVKRIHGRRVVRKTKGLKRLKVQVTVGGASGRTTTKTVLLRTGKVG